MAATRLPWRTHGDYRRFPRLIYDVSRDVYAHCITESKAKRAQKGEVDAGQPPPSIHDLEVARARWEKLAALYEQMKGALAHFNVERSTKNRHIIEVRDSAQCWNLGQLGSRICFYDAGSGAGSMTALDSDGCEWVAYEEKCMAAGDGYCEFVITTEPGENLDSYLNSCGSSNCEDVMNGLVKNVTDSALKGAPGAERPVLGNETHFSFFQESTSVPALSNERFMLAVRLAGANVGKRLAENFLEAGVKAEKAHKVLATVFTKLKVGRLVLGDTVKLYENCESQGIRLKEPICFFTTGFLNSFFNTIDGFRVKELRCVGAAINSVNGNFYKV